MSKKRWKYRTNWLGRLILQVGRRVPTAVPGEVGEEDVDAIADVLLSRIVTGWRTAYIGSAWRKAEVSIQGIEGAEREWAERAAREILARLRTSSGGGGTPSSRTSQRSAF